MKAIGMYLFGGSSSIGAMSAGYEIDRILEMTDEMLQQNAYHFHKNYPNIPIELPTNWNKERYLQSLQKENYDLLLSNCPCSGLSQINRNASVDSDTNIHFYEVFNAINKIKPKAFLIENAPTLIKKGFPILQRMVDELSDDYKFSIVRDYAGNHNVAMQRMRTLVIGWRKDIFNNKIPLIHMNKVPRMTIKDLIGDLYNIPLGSCSNHVLHDDRDWKQYDELLIPHVKSHSSMLLTTIEKYDQFENYFKDDVQTTKQIKTAKAKKEANKNIWDKTPWREDENRAAPSLTSVSCYIHPVNNRQWTIREYARLMGYPDNFEFFLDGGCETDIIQCLAQGVPAMFIEYISNEIQEALNGNRTLQNDTEDKTLCFQHHTKSKYKSFTTSELSEMNGLDVDNKDKTFKDLEK